ncbi:hypothetical protein GCG54_00007604 [Colletotrichum gloeosporioides]|uniref:Uncharacterized protein n=1 Tax=Colletotrichum gloeosporioides TaxID=474922 RepID=A0A8H4CQ27_COLGL|nr:uncharacterized protein GCG54_00007604 [Colletotrichum gloeosporioides]KAF3807869.1 hypothetical protein GCG54_00007604 [Colletotrichum gloeosporioides]
MAKLTDLPPEIILMIIKILRPRLDGKLLVATGHEKASAGDYYDTAFTVSDLLHENSQKRHALASFSLSHKAFSQASVEQFYSIAGIHNLSEGTGLKRMTSLLQLIDRDNTVRTSIRHLYVSTRHPTVTRDSVDFYEAEVATLLDLFGSMSLAVPCLEYLDSTAGVPPRYLIGYCVALILIRLPSLQELTLSVPQPTLRTMAQVLSVARTHQNPNSNTPTPLSIPTLQALTTSDLGLEYIGELEPYLWTKPGSERCFHSSVLCQHFNVSTVTSLVLDKVHMEVPLLVKTVRNCLALRKLVCVRFAALMMSSSDLDAFMDAIQDQCKTLVTLCLDLSTWHYVQDQRVYDRIATLGDLPSLEQLWITTCTFADDDEEDNIDNSESQGHNSNGSDTDDSNLAGHEVFETFLPSLPASLKRLHLGGGVRPIRQSLLDIAQRIKMGGLRNLREIGLSRGQWDDELEEAFAEYVPVRTTVDPRPAMW